MEKQKFISKVILGGLFLSLFIPSICFFDVTQITNDPFPEFSTASHTMRFFNNEKWRKENLEKHCKFITE